MADLDGLVQQWSRLDSDKSSRKTVKKLQESDPEHLYRMMTPRIAFGTAGLRSEMAPGFANMNLVTVTQASQGLAVYVKDTIENAQARGIVIGHDHRHNSADFAHALALTFAHAGFKVHFLGQVHTPMVPFGIRYLQAACGVCITASHNPAKDNGYKVYWENACQIIPPHDSGIAEQIDKNLDSWDLGDHNKTFPKLDLFDEYKKLVLEPSNVYANKLQFLGPIVYTPMHGIGWEAAKASFEISGADARVVAEQKNPDPDFPSVKFPNPEEKGALDSAIKYADCIKSRIVLANDPDADRFSCAVNEPGIRGWTQLTGDQIGVLSADYISHRPRNNDKKIAVINTAVSSQQSAKQAKLAKVEYFETLTGFKWLGNKAIDLTKQGYSVPLAYEEAIGYMVSEYIRDKDGVSASHMFAQLIYEHYSHERTLHGELERISKETGYFATHNSYYVVPSPSVTTKTFNEIRKAPFPAKRTHIGDLEITAWRDLTTGYDSNQPDYKPLLPVSASSEMSTVYLRFPGNKSTTARFTARGSGTEPKSKIYIEASSDSEKSAQDAADYVWDLSAKEWFANLK